VHVFFPAIETHINTVAATILSENGMKRLMDVAEKVGLGDGSADFGALCCPRVSGAR
jgi:hypothetical protein